MSSARKLDQFYTTQAVAQQCWKALKPYVPHPRKCVYLEPSAGAGAFFSLMPAERRIGLDLEPKYQGVTRGDFFEFVAPDSSVGGICTVGNPPFGKNASLAVRFFQHASQFSELIAFIVPKSFRKASVQKRLNPFFHLEADLDLPANAFEFEGQPYDVPCCFQIWRKKSTPRAHKDAPLQHADFDFVSREVADFAVRRVGARAGAIIENFEGYSDASHYFLRANIPVGRVVEVLQCVDWSEAKANNAGNPSISKRELVEGYASAKAALGAPAARLPHRAEALLAA